MIERDSIDERDLAILETTPIPIFIHQDLLFVWMNRAAEQLLIMVGKVRKREDAYGQPVMAWTAPEEPTDLGENSLRVQDQGEEVTEQRRTFVTDRGDRVNCIGSARSVLWKGRPAVEVVILFTDYIPSDPALLPRHAPPSLSTLSPAQLRVAIKLAQGYDTKESAPPVDHRSHGAGSSGCGLRQDGHALSHRPDAAVVGGVGELTAANALQIGAGAAVAHA